MPKLGSDNGTEYTESMFQNYLDDHGILHQTSCVNTPAQNGVAERKNRHLLEVARSLLFAMNVPKNYWGDAIMSAAYLINRMPLRTIDFKTPLEKLIGSNGYTVPPKVFGCTCFVHDHRRTLDKLDPRAMKCIFIGYSASQKGYKCYYPPTRKTFITMDVTFREHEAYFSRSSLQGESKIEVEEMNAGAKIHIEDMPYWTSRLEVQGVGVEEKEEEMNTMEVGEETDEVEGQKDDEEKKKAGDGEWQVYTRKRKKHKAIMQTLPGQERAILGSSSLFSIV